MPSTSQGHLPKAPWEVLQNRLNCYTTQQTTLKAPVSTWACSISKAIVWMGKALNKPPKLTKWRVLVTWWPFFLLTGSAERQPSDLVSKTDTENHGKSAPSEQSPQQLRVQSRTQHPTHRYKTATRNTGNSFYYSPSHTRWWCLRIIIGILFGEKEICHLIYIYNLTSYTLSGYLIGYLRTN